MTRDEAQLDFGTKLSNGEFDKEIEKILLDWQVDNAKKRIEDFSNNLDATYDGERLSVSGLSQRHIDELLTLGRELHQETRRAYLKANLEQYLHDLKYTAEPSIYITDAEWVGIRNGQANNLEVYRNWVTSKIDAMVEVVETEDETTKPKRGRKAKTVE